MSGDEIRNQLGLSREASKRYYTCERDQMRLNILACWARYQRDEPGCEHCGVRREEYALALECDEAAKQFPQKS